MLLAAVYPCFPMHNAGRKDAAVPDPTDRLPEETLSAEALRLNFAAKGMSAQELVALSGAHTVRQCPCMVAVMCYFMQ